MHKDLSEPKGRSAMKKTKTFPALAAGATLGIAAIVSPQTAEAHWRGGGAVAAGIIGGLAAGAIIGAAASGPYYAYGPGPYNYGGYGPGGCFWAPPRGWAGGGGGFLAGGGLCLALAQYTPPKHGSRKKTGCEY